MGKHYVRLHEGTRDAQAVWRNYSQYMRTSTKADIELESLMTNLTSLRFSTSTQSTATGFVVGWLDQLRWYENLTPTSAHFPDLMKKAMLQNALNDVKAFNDIKVSEQVDIAKGHGSILYNANKIPD